MGLLGNALLRGGIKGHDDVCGGDRRDDTHDRPCKFSHLDMNRRTGCVALGIDWAQNFDHQSVPSASLKLHRSTSYLPRRAPHVLYRSRYDLTNYSGVCVSDCFFVRVTLTCGVLPPSSACASSKVTRTTFAFSPRIVIFCTVGRGIRRFACGT